MSLLRQLVRLLDEPVELPDIVGWRVDGQRDDVLRRQLLGAPRREINSPPYAARVRLSFAPWEVRGWEVARQLPPSLLGLSKLEGTLGCIPCGPRYLRGVVHCQNAVVREVVQQRALAEEPRVEAQVLDLVPFE